MARSDVTQRFSDRVEHYVRHRPDYPPQLIEWLHGVCHVDPAAAVADVGAGTGISSRLFLDAGHPVIAVEPNAPMRQAAIDWLGHERRFRAVAGRAESTGLDDASVDLVAAAQAFHWFDHQAVRREWRRILRPDGRVVVFWNSRRTDGTPFLDGYETLLREYGTDYLRVAERYTGDDAMRAWFGTGFVGMARFQHRQRLDLDGLLGRLMSSSYTPPPDHRDHLPMLQAARRLFDTCAQDGMVELIYDTRVFAGTPA
jgi:SAM-dependent methyltransferase